MAIAQVVAGNRIVVSDLNVFYNLLKGVTGSGEAVTLIHNAAHSLTFQPSSDPAAGTEVVAVKNNAGAVQLSLTFDGKVKVADGTAALPSLRFQSEATGWALAAAATPILSIAGVEHLRLTTTALTLAAAASRIVPGATSLSLRNNANTADNVLIADAGGVTLRTSLAFATAVGQIIPGATSLSLRNNANSADNLIITDAGAATIRATLAVGTTPAATGVIRIPNNQYVVAKDHLGNDRTLLGIDGSGIGILYDAGTGAGQTITRGTLDGTGHGAAGGVYWKN